MTATITNRKNMLFDPTELHSNITPYQFITSSLKDFWGWWYLQQPISLLKKYIRLVDIIDDKFSTSFLIRTFFVPWHRDNQFAGYLIGIIARLMFIPIGLILIAFATTGYLTALLFWIFIPPVSVIMFIISPVI